MTRYVTDTHAFGWHLQSSPKLSQTGQAIYNDADRGTNEIAAPSIVLVELVFLAERKRIERALVATAFDALEASPIITELPRLICQSFELCRTLILTKSPKCLTVLSQQQQSIWEFI